MRGSHRPAAIVLGVVVSAVLVASATMLSGCGSSSGSAPRSAAPSFSGTTLEGTQVSLSDYLGKPLVLVFMASWCGPCRAEAPEIEQFYQQNKDRAAVLGVAVDDTEEDMRSLMDENGWAFPVMLQGDGAARAYGVRTIPHTVVIDAEGFVVKRIFGGTTAAKLSLLIDGITR